MAQVSRRFATIALLAAVMILLVVAGARTVQSVQNARAELTEAVDGLAGQYRSVWETQAAGLTGLTGTAQTAMDSGIDAIVSLESTTLFSEKIAATQALQKSLLTLARETEGASFGELRREMGERGAAKGFIQTYNDAAKIWNDLSAGGLTGWLTRRSGDTEELPFLRFDGEEETSEMAF